MALLLQRGGITCAVAVIACASGCVTAPPARQPSPPRDAPSVSSDIALPSPNLLALAEARGEATGVNFLVGTEFGRNDGRLGSPPAATVEQVWFELSVFDRQLVLNGQSQPEYRRTLRAVQLFGP
ncbi:MAG: hypothetical protein SGJ09_10390 [Phycisphaerae bacterium]|nr:hypothetical protein [Phycisphaerae bacterium]